MNISKNTYVMIHRIILNPGERSPNVPEETAKVPLEMRIKGYLLKDSAIGEEAEIVTETGRKESGIVVEVNPSYSHSFGECIPEILDIGAQIRGIIAGEAK